MGITIGLMFIKNRKSKPALIATNITHFHDFSIRKLNQKDSIHLAAFAGKKILCVNVASKCGYTPQYESLEKLAQKYSDKLVVIGFPCNQFMSQEPGLENEIEAFCKKTYAVSFLMSEKIDVKGDHQHPIYQWLTKKELNGQSDANVKWNFNKFLIDEKGNWLAYFPSSVEPLSEEITNYLK